MALPDPSYCNNGVLRQATRRLGQLYDEILAPCGLRATQHGLLATIRRLGAPTMKELAEFMVMDLSALGHTLKPLTRDGFVALSPDARDGRVRRVALTPAGMDKLEQSMALWRTAQGRFERAFGMDKAAELRAVLSFVASPEFHDTFVGTAAPDETPTTRS